MKNVKLRVKKAHKASFDYSVAFKKGDKVKVGKEDPEMPSWFWCENKDGVWSWIPQEYLTREGSEGTITHGYDTTELTVAIGETLEYLREVKFWTLCRTRYGKEGWVPTRNLERVDEQSVSDLNTKHSVGREQKKE
jgi:SH3-like domain-containing protein